MSYTKTNFFLLACAVLCPVLWAAGAGQAESAKPDPAPALTSQQFQGEGIFLQNCSFCHFPHKVSSQSAVRSAEDNPKSTVPGHTIGPDLKGILKGESPMSDQAARTIIQQGFPGQMPGFRYGLDPKEIDAVIAYMKTL
jgi:mono/diheme cytochrome c family protein